MKKNKKVRSCAYHLFCAALALIMIYPVLWLGFSAFKEKTDIFQEAGKLLPTKWFFENFLHQAGSEIY